MQLTIKQLQEMLRISRSTINRRLDDGLRDIAIEKNVNGRLTYYFDKEEAIKWFQENCPQYLDK